MEDKIRYIYQDFDNKRKKIDALRADEEDLEELNELDQIVKETKHD